MICSRPRALSSLRSLACLRWGMPVGILILAQSMRGRLKSPPIITVEGRSTLIASFSSLRIKSVIQGLNSNVATFVTSSFVDKHRTDTTFTLTL